MSSSVRTRREDVAAMSHKKSCWWNVRSEYRVLPPRSSPLGARRFVYIRLKIV
jgi:hypothetical protein